MVTQERAREIWQTKSPFGKMHVTPDEDAYIRKVWATMPGHTCFADAVLRIANGVIDDASLEGVGNTLVEACLCFIEREDVPISQEEWGEFAGTLVDDSSGLPEFAGKLRQLVAKLLGTVKGFDSTRYWLLIDAIGFWQDAHPGRWPHMRSNDCRRYLQWALEHARASVFEQDGPEFLPC